jgi:hypothetical protein
VLCELLGLLGLLEMRLFCVDGVCWVAMVAAGGGGEIGEAPGGFELAAHANGRQLLPDCAWEQIPTAHRGLASDYLPTEALLLVVLEGTTRGKQRASNLHKVTLEAWA